MLFVSKFLKKLLYVPEDNPDLAIAQVKMFSRQIPLMYGMVIVNTLALAYSYLGAAPDWLSIYVPVLLVSISAFRTLSYWRAGKQEMSAGIASQKLRQTIIFAGLLGAFFSSWALALFKYGDPYSQGHVAFFSGVTSLGIVVCLMHLRVAAIVLAVTTVGPTSLFLLIAGGQEHTAVGLNLMIVTVAVLYVLSNHSRNFIELISNQSALRKAVSEANELGKENEKLANLDSLTGLPNRRRFLTELGQRIADDTGENESFSVGILDLDGFKPINDIYGHIAGDRLLGKVAERLSNSDRDLFVARLGGDEFGLILEGNLTDSEILSLGNFICSTVGVPFEMDGFTANVGGTIGIAKFPDSGRTEKQLFERSDYALYVAKECQKGTAVMFSEEHQAEINETTGILRELQGANFDEEFYVEYQFVVDSATGTPVGAEALARWTNPILGKVSPTDFIKNAEKSGIVNKITETLLKKTLSEVSHWPEDLFVSFNLSAHDIGSSHNISRLTEIVRDSGFPPERLTFEITETSLLRDLNKAHDTLQMLKGLGSKIALDDFGTGYSSLSYVQALPIDKLKIDRSFLDKMETCQTSQAVIKTILELCENLKLDCIIEGVEKESQLSALQEIGSMHIQGYLFSKPMLGRDALTYLQMFPNEIHENYITFVETSVVNW